MVRNMGAVTDESITVDNSWEKVKKESPHAIKIWIAEQMKSRSCVVVLVGRDTYDRPWINYEINKAMVLGKALVGVRIHNINDMDNGTTTEGKNPFDVFTIEGVSLSSLVECYDPPSNNAYGYINDNLGKWIESSITNRYPGGKIGYSGKRALVSDVPA